MEVLLALAMLSDFYPLARSLAASRGTTLPSALTWLAAARVAWVATVLVPDSLVLPYLALCLSGCAGVAVLGARRPGVAAWNFVVFGLLAVLLLPVASGLGTPRLEPAHFVFLSATLAVVLLNYLPTRAGVAVPLEGAAYALEIARLAGASVPASAILTGRILLTLSPWAAWLALRRRLPSSEVDRLWLGFRDGYGFLWAQRVREQFNRSAASAGWQVRLSWSGLKPTTEHDEALATLRALLKRFRTSIDYAQPGEENGRSAGTSAR
jgi:hypothetical protein